jgi:hypothetical protein
MIVRLLLIGLLLLGAASPAHAQTPSTSFFAAAHPDDWQLFETPNAIDDVLTPQHKTVFIYFTAGGGGSGMGNASPTVHVPYSQAREEAAKRSLRFVVGLAGDAPAPTTSTVEINHHTIRRYVDGPTVSYFLRLPDGNSVDGNGYPATGMQSLLRLHGGAIDSLAAIDGSTTYGSWSDLISTLTALIKSEAQGSATVWINVHDPDRRTNPFSHPDHYQTGMAMQAAVRSLPCINQALYVDYTKSALPPNLSVRDLQLQTATFAAVISGMTDAGFKSNYMIEREWLGRDYYRTVNGTGACRWPQTK